MSDDLERIGAAIVDVYIRTGRSCCTAEIGAKLGTSDSWVRKVLRAGADSSPRGSEPSGRNDTWVRYGFHERVGEATGYRGQRVYLPLLASLRARMLKRE